MAVGPYVGKPQAKEIAMQKALCKQVGRLVHLKSKNTKSWLKAVTVQLCIHRTEQPRLHSLDLLGLALLPSLTLTARYLFEKTNWFNPTGDNQAVFRLWPLWLSSWDCCKGHKSSEMTQIFRNQLHLICNGYAGSIKNNIPFPKGRPTRILRKFLYRRKF